MDEATKRRVQTGRLLLQGRPPTEVAAAVGAPRPTVYRLLDVLRVMRKGGRPLRLDAE